MNVFLPLEIRALFPGATNKVYLNIAETTLIPRPTSEAAHAYVDATLSGTGDKAAHRASVERAVAIIQPSLDCFA